MLGRVVQETPFPDAPIGGVWLAIRRRHATFGVTNTSQ